MWRAGKNNVPGNEIVLYQESGDDRFFGDIVFANPGAFFGYFIATYHTATGLKSQIKRVPLTGGSAIVIADSPAPDVRDLQTDGTTLYWIETGGIRSAPIHLNVPIGGEPVTTLFADGFVGRISLDPAFVYFGEEFLIMRIPKNGGSPETVARTNGRVSALYVDSAIGWMFWGEKEGGVRAAQTFFEAPQVTYQLPGANRAVNSVGWDGQRVLWADCVQPGNTNCRIRKREAGITRQIVGGAVGISHLQWDTRSLYWGDVSSLKRFVY